MFLSYLVDVNGDSSIYDGKFCLSVWRPSIDMDSHGDDGNACMHVLFVNSIVMQD